MKQLEIMYKTGLHEFSAMMEMMKNFPTEVVWLSRASLLLV
jgi:hypothetical protein